MSSHTDSNSKVSYHKELVTSNIFGGSGFFIVKWQSDNKKISSAPSESTCPHHPFTVLLQRQLTDARNRCRRGAEDSNGVINVLPIDEVGTITDNSDATAAAAAAARQQITRHHSPAVQYRDWPAGRSHYELKQDDQLLASEQMTTLMDYVEPLCSAYFSSLPHGANNNYSKVSLSSVYVCMYVCMYVYKFIERCVYVCMCIYVCKH